jgi:phosphoglycolate phosphatase
VETWHGRRDAVTHPPVEERVERSQRARIAMQRSSRSGGVVSRAANQAQKLALPMAGRSLTTASIARPHRGNRSLQDPLVILFDVDGTLISTGGAGTRSWRWAFEELHGIPADIGEYTEAGMTDPVVGRSTFRNVLHRDPTDAEMRSLVAAYLERLPTEVQASERYRVLPGAEDVLRSLDGTGRVTGIVTGALEEAARIKLARGDLNRYLPFGGFGSDSADRAELTRRAIERGAALIRRELAPGRVHVIGDTPRDMEAAAALGAVPIGITTGTYRADSLTLAGADVVLETLEAYPALLVSGTRVIHLPPRCG